MTTDHSFEMGPPATADQVADALAATAAALDLVTSSGIRFERPGAALRSGLFIVTTASTPPPFPDPLEEVFGFSSTAGALFRPYRGADVIEQRKEMIRLVVGVLAAVTGDAWLAFEGEMTDLVRIADKITIGMNDGFWEPEVVALLPPHDRAPLPNL